MADLYYDDQKRLIATDVAGLLIYFQSITGVNTAANVVYSLPCSMSALVRITGGAILPKFIYKNGLTPANKIYLQQIKVVPQNFAPLCNGATFSNTVPPPVIGIELVNMLNYILQESGIPNIYTNEIGIPLIQET